MPQCASKIFAQEHLLPKNQVRNAGTFRDAIARFDAFAQEYLLPKNLELDCQERLQAYQTVFEGRRAPARAAATSSMSTTPLLRNTTVNSFASSASLAVDTPTHKPGVKVFQSPNGSSDEEIHTPQGLCAQEEQVCEVRHHQEGIPLGRSRWYP